MLKHITEQYGEATNLIEIPEKDFFVLKEFLSSAGVDLRMVTEFKGIVTAQAKPRNVGSYWE